MNPQKQKSIARKLALKKRNALTLPQQQQKSLLISQILTPFLLKLLFKHHTHSVLSYMHFQTEVQTSSINQILLNHSIQLGLPRIRQQKLHFFNVRSLQNDCSKGSYHILEPHSFLPPSNLQNVQFAILPGAAFDLYGTRLGYGLGFYDRFLAKYPHIQSIGLAYQLQVTPKLPRQNHDTPLSFLITENKIYHFTP